MIHEITLSYMKEHEIRVFVQSRTKVGPAVTEPRAGSERDKNSSPPDL